MIARSLELMLALGGKAAEADARAALIADRLRQSGTSSAKIADAICGVLEARSDEGSNTRGAWMIATTVAAVVAAVLATRGLLGAFALLRPYSSDTLAYVPLGGILIALIAWARARHGQLAAREAAMLDFAVALSAAGAPSALAVEAAAFLSGVSEQTAKTLAGGELSSSEPERSHLVLLRELSGVHSSRFGWMVLPALSAAWVVISYWGLYFTSIAAHATAPWFER